MDESRRSFLKTAGVSLLGVSAIAPVGNAMASEMKTGTFSGAKTGKRWAMIIDIKKCLSQPNCDKCIQACHSAHNVPEIRENAAGEPDPKGKINKQHEVKWLWKAEYEHSFPTVVHEFTEDNLKNKPVLVTCNHCVNPPCVKVCPTQATWKRDSDGIVMMDMHRCIGCRYCMAGCPYGARSFNWKDPRDYIDDKKMHQTFPTRSKGVVEKCNFCAERLAQGQIPACVETSQRSGCGALMFGDLGDKNSPLRKVLDTRHNIRRKVFLGTEPNLFYIVA